MLAKAILNDAYIPQLDNMARVQIVFGGAGSGKSVFKAQQAVLDVMSNKRNWLVCRKVGRDSRRSTFTEVNKVISSWGLASYFDVNKNDMTITCHTGYQIMFIGMDDQEKIKSITPPLGAWTDVWIEEATQAERNDIVFMRKRQRGGDEKTPKRLHLTFNPIYKTHHIYQDFFTGVAWEDGQTEYNSDDLSILKTWYIHNKFLTPDDIDDLLNEKDEYFRDVYTFGNWGVLGDVIFKNWSVQDLSGMRDQFTNYRHGLDFGFSSDPAAMPCTHYDRAHKTIYIFDELYERGLTNDVLASEVISKIGKEIVRCDSAEPKSIAELQQHGVSAIATKKGKDSILFGIQWLQQQVIIVSHTCINMRTEFEVCHWKKDKDGNAIRQPSEKMNHLLDGLRYAYEDESLESWYVLG